MLILVGGSGRPGLSPRLPFLSLMLIGATGILLLLLVLIAATELLVLLDIGVISGVANTVSAIETVLEGGWLIEGAGAKMVMGGRRVELVWVMVRGSLRMVAIKV